MSDAVIPDLYADGLSVGAGMFGVTISLIRTIPTEAAPAPSLAPAQIEVVARIRMSPELCEYLLKILPLALKNRPKLDMDALASQLEQVTAAVVGNQGDDDGSR